LLPLLVVAPMATSECSQNDPFALDTVGCMGANHFAYIIYQDSPLVSAHAVDDSGNFCAAGLSEAGMRPSAIATATVDPGTVSLLKIGANGVLLKNGAPQTTGKNPGDRSAIQSSAC
jgi:hypothetical protein